ncbi:uncharacterized protein SPPG_02454 [Spizellomyces punctatus DAOM BR117]|uniref:Uncharacterized protein n=1 Tax=Spizellomyces punctatus (strain DAOM BR117) TaxID=645134 RepID=A0A0L0HLE5_SPIPD|nr:uncharacterized protein SPPG_02454 [Spizellomyces punctatus DAOM BR117]KND01947.1 hypothetical protein SPPG_02454 [Spizellomyces punctatus DAOM BR117]|eukprot:XP_016609986.1 hypothetical protein SPPG_02454 [Spizellomyces punctatus DAOM BR117]
MHSKSLSVMIPHRVFQLRTWFVAVILFELCIDLARAGDVAFSIGHIPSPIVNSTAGTSGIANLRIQFDYTYVPALNGSLPTISASWKCVCDGLGSGPLKALPTEQMAASSKQSLSGSTRSGSLSIPFGGASTLPPRHPGGTDPTITCKIDLRWTELVNGVPGASNAESPPFIVCVNDVICPQEGRLRQRPIPLNPTNVSKQQMVATATETGVFPTSTLSPATPTNIALAFPSSGWRSSQLDKMIILRMVATSVSIVSLCSWLSM